MLDASNTYLILQLFPCFSVVVSGLPDLTGKWKQAFTVLTPVDFGQLVFTGKAVTPKRKAGGSNPPGNGVQDARDEKVSRVFHFPANISDRRLAV